MTKELLTIEPHGDGYAVYSGRDNKHHGSRLFNVTDTTEAGLKVMQELLMRHNAVGTFSVRNFSTDDDWTLEIQADGVRIASGYPSGNPGSLAGSGAKCVQLVELANEALRARRRKDRASEVRENDKDATS